MGELTLTAFLTLDGVMQAPGGPDEDTSGGFIHGGWVVPNFDAAGGQIIDGIFARANAFLLGRKTYELFAAYWPRVTEPGNLVAEQLNTRPKYVASHTRRSFEWAGTSVIWNVLTDVPAIKRRLVGELQVHGSAELAQTLIEHDLIDEYRLFTFPVVVGTGKRLFGAGAVPSAYALQRTETTGSGVVFSVYRRVGGLRTGSFALE